MVWIHPRGRAYHPGTAHVLAVCAQAAYLDGDKVEPWVGQIGEIRSFGWFDANSTQAFVIEGENSIIISFRGTEPTSLTDWMSDLNTALVGGPGGGLVHEGFQMALLAIWKDLLEYLFTLRNGSTDKKTLWITGHSLGGALATLAAAKLRLEREQPVNGVYTFGQPRVGDIKFRQAYDLDMGARHFRLVHNNDIVPRVPFRAMSYRHAGQLVYFNYQRLRMQEMEWWEILLDRVKGRWEDLFDPGTDGVKDHSMLEYMACVRRDKGA